jgi:GNAT superfamily N-acetyltransferase
MTAPAAPAAPSSPSSPPTPAPGVPADAGPALQLDPVERPDEALRQAIQAPLAAYNTAVAGPSGHQPLAVVLRDADGTVQGGLWGHTAYGWLYTQLLVVPDGHRAQGLGAALMARAEAMALSRGCRHAWVDTIFGARGFYERLGYRVFGELPDHPPGHTRSFLRKDLDADR